MCYGGIVSTHTERRAQATEILGGRCVSCGTTDHLEIDHIVPGERRGRTANGRRPKLSKRAIAAVLAGRTDGLQLLCGRGSEKNCHQVKTTAERRAKVAS